MGRYLPQPKQWAFLATPADIALFGGGAGAGKTFALAMEPIRHKDVPGFSCAVFRRQKEQFRGRGGIWDEMEALYPGTGADGRDSILEWNWPSGAQVKCYHLEYEKDKYTHDGKQYALLLFDELQHFTETQFFYLLSRNRSACGVSPYVRATCNPDADSWLAGFVSWWIDDEGFPIPERSGVIRWFVREGGEVIWGDTMEEVADKVPHIIGDSDPRFFVKSFTFIPALLEDNPALLEKDPRYRGNLAMLDPVEQARLAKGNWKVRYRAGSMFPPGSLKVVPHAPDTSARVRIWDFAATEDAPGKDPDWCVGMLLGRTPDNRVCVLDVERIRAEPPEVEARVRAIADLDGPSVEIIIEQEPGSSGKIAFNYYANHVLPDRVVHCARPKGDKTQRTRPVSGAAGNGRVLILEAPWTMTLIRELEAFPSSAAGVHDDQVDCLSSGFNHWFTEPDEVGWYLSSTVNSTSTLF